MAEPPGDDGSARAAARALVASAVAGEPADPQTYPGEGLPILVEYLIQRYTAMAGKRLTHIAKPPLDLLRSYDWPGNIREPQNVIQRVVVLSDGRSFRWGSPGSGVSLNGAA